MKCGRTACNNKHQHWWNRVTEKFYCQPCAFKINDASRKMFVEPLCARTLGPTDK